MRVLGAASPFLSLPHRLFCAFLLPVTLTQAESGLHTWTCTWANTWARSLVQKHVRAHTRGLHHRNTHYWGNPFFLYLFTFFFWYWQDLFCWVSFSTSSASVGSRGRFSGYLKWVKWLSLDRCLLKEPMWRWHTIFQPLKVHRLPRWAQHLYNGKHINKLWLGW